MPTPTIPAGSLALVIGINSHIGSHVAKILLDRGYRVRGTVRDLNKSAWVTDELFKEANAAGKIELVAVADLAVRGALDTAVKGVDFIFNIAATLPTSNVEDKDSWIPLALATAQVLLDAAASEPSVKELVITGSEVAASFKLRSLKTHVTQDTWNELALSRVDDKPPYSPDRFFYLYAASKVFFEREIWKFVRERKPSFSVNFVHPACVLGEPLNAEHLGRGWVWPTGSVASFFKNDQAAVDSSEGRVELPWFIDVKDVALAHVAAALDPDTKNERIHQWGHYRGWNGVLKELRGLYPERKFPNDLPNEPKESSMTVDQDIALGLVKKWGNQDDFVPLKDMVKDTVKPLE